MFRNYRIRRAHARFLESCRNLSADQRYWAKAGRFRRWLIEAFIPVPVMGLHEDGEAIWEALQHLEADCRSTPLGEGEILRYHETVLRKIRPEEAGRYRRHELRMSANPLKPPAPQKISALMSALHATLKDVQREFDRAYPADPSAVLRAAVETYHRIGVIHPFQDGNGRVARLAMNHLLRRYQLGYVIYPPLSHCPPLWQALLQAGNGVLDPLMDIARACWHKV